jgi:hypothetical protein
VNIDPTSNRHGEIVQWDSLSEADQKSGQWIKLPTHDENGQPVMARRISLIEEIFGVNHLAEAEKNARRVELLKALRHG